MGKYGLMLIVPVGSNQGNMVVNPLLPKMKLFRASRYRNYFRAEHVRLIAFPFSSSWPCYSEPWTVTVRKALCEMVTLPAPSWAERLLIPRVVVDRTTD